jgi:hypothetical protein
MIRSNIPTNFSQNLMFGAKIVREIFITMTLSNADHVGDYSVSIAGNRIVGYMEKLRRLVSVTGQTGRILDMMVQKVTKKIDPLQIPCYSIFVIFQ